MTDPISQVDDVVVTGQRRPAGVIDPFPASGTPVWPAWAVEKGEGHTGIFDPCRAPRTRKEWNRDAGAAAAVQAMKQAAVTLPLDGDRGFPAREYGAVLWELANGTIMHGPITWGEHSFLEAYQNAGARATVVLDWTRPAPGAVPYGTVHSHGAGSHIPSGIPGSPRQSDYGVLTSTQEWREFYSGITNGWEARLYIASDVLAAGGQTPKTQINVYDRRNIEQAVTGTYTGPEVNPEGQPCLPQ